MLTYVPPGLLKFLDEIASGNCWLTLFSSHHRMVANEAACCLRTLGAAAEQLQKQIDDLRPKLKEAEEDAAHWKMSWEVVIQQNAELLQRLKAMEQHAAQIVVYAQLLGAAAESADNDEEPEHYSTR